MQVTGTFPELTAGRSQKRANSSGKFRKADTAGMSFGVNGRGPRKTVSNPSTYAGRRAASHAAARNRS